MNKIRTGIIRCDLHAIWYANLIQKHDPDLLREPDLGAVIPYGRKSIGFET